MPLLLTKTSVSVQAFYPHCSFEALKCVRFFGHVVILFQGTFSEDCQISLTNSIIHPVSGLSFHCVLRILLLLFSIRGKSKGLIQVNDAADEL